VISQDCMFFVGFYAVVTDDMVLDFLLSFLYFWFNLVEINNSNRNDFARIFDSSWIQK
jgi:hypothetical protein